MEKQIARSTQEPPKDERKLYVKPAVLRELRLEVRAGSPVISSPFDPYNMGVDPNQH